MNSVPASIEASVGALLQKAGRAACTQKIAFEAMEGNTIRNDYETRCRFLVRSEGTVVAVLTLGKDLSELRRRSDLFSAAYPDLACTVFAHDTNASGDILLSDFFSGLTASAALDAPEIGQRGVLSALNRLAERFTAEIKSSSADALAEEVDTLLAKVLAIPYWTATDRSFLESTVLPFSEKFLKNAPAVCRPSNGDLVLSNILLNAQGQVKVIDYEQAAVTHFYAEDWLRLTCWKAPEGLRTFALGQVENPDVTQLYFWLKQLVFESEVMQPSKAAADLQHWAKQIGLFVAQRNSNLSKSLFWPSENKQNFPEILRFHSQAHYNYTRAVDLWAFCEYSLDVSKYKQLCLQDEITRQRDLVQQRELKIRQMQESFSWRSTSWLRALRRKFIDSYSRKKPARRQPKLPLEAQTSEITLPYPNADFLLPEGGQFHYRIERPLDWSNACGALTIEGWVFTQLPIKLAQIRARLKNRVFLGTYGLDRKDVNEKFLPQAHGGFRIECTTEKADTEVVLEVGDENGAWYPFFSKLLLIQKRPPRQTSSHNYDSWVARYDTLSHAQLETLRRQSAEITPAPLISIIMPVYNTQAEFLSRAIESVLQQVYPHWELCIADDASTEAHVRPILEKYRNQDPRIKAVFRANNGHISAASNSALELATGQFVAFLDHDDELAPHALFYIAKSISNNPRLEIIYSDEDKIDEAGHRFTPHFKPDWNPDLLTSQNYFCHLTAYRLAAVQAVGGFRLGYEGSQDWDLALRISDRAKSDQICHIPRVLYHWRAIESSTANALSAKNYTNEAARKTLEDHFARRGISVKLSTTIGSHWRTRYTLPSPAPFVTLIIPTRNRRELLVKCVDSIFNNTSYSNFNVLIADNDSDDSELLSYYEQRKTGGRFSVISCPGPFNFSSINNQAVRHARGDIIGFLNNDLETMHSDWLEEMVSHALRPEIGVVGAKLYYPDMTVQHAGVITGLGGVAGHAFKHFPRAECGTPQFRPHLVHNISAVTAACSVIRRSIFDEVGGFDENNLKVAFNDVDFCLRVQALGYRNLFTPFAELIHHESASRGPEDSPEKIARFQSEIAFMKQRWGQQLLNDPAYNPNFSLDTENFAYASPPRVPQIPP